MLSNGDFIAAKANQPPLRGSNKKPRSRERAGLLVESEAYLRTSNCEAPFTELSTFLVTFLVEEQQAALLSEQVDALLLSQQLSPACTAVTQAKAARRERTWSFFMSQTHS
jgi:hypothetical protein